MCRAQHDLVQESKQTDGSPQTWWCHIVDTKRLHICEFDFVQEPTLDLVQSVELGRTHEHQSRSLVFDDAPNLHFEHSEERCQRVQVLHSDEGPNAWLDPSRHPVQNLNHAKSCVHHNSKETEGIASALPRMQNMEKLLRTIELDLVLGSPLVTVVLQGFQIILDRFIRVRYWSQNRNCDIISEEVGLCI